ncbi:MAG: MFS transporter [Dermatophilaceae bacterium]
MTQEHLHREAAPLGPSDIIHDDAVPSIPTAEYRRVALATAVGTTIEWYDFFIYANVAALLFGKLFFGGLGQWAQLASLATVGVSFFFRPLGAIVMGRVGDRIGRRAVLIFTLVLMGAATTLVGALPTSAQIGIAAPVLLILLRCLQGFSAGGEWGGAAMLAVEHAPHGRRGRFGAFPQLGVPAGMLIATGLLSLMSAALSQESFESWGWRVPFLFSIVLVFVGQWIRRRVEESAVFLELKQDQKLSKSPLREVLTNHPRRIIQAALVFIGNNAIGYMITGGFILGYATKTLKLPQTQVMIFVVLAAAIWFASTWIGANLSDRIGRVKVYTIGYVFSILWVFPMFLLLREPNLAMVAIALMVTGIPQGLTYGPQSALYAEMFPASIRLSGVSLAYAIGAILGGAFSPTIAEFLTQQFGTVTSVGFYLATWALISLVTVNTIKDRSQEPLHTISGH